MAEQIISAYAGAGGIDEGLKQAGKPTTIAIEKWPTACKTLKLNHPDIEVICGLVSDYIESLPKNVFAVVGGPPCPEFSRANTKRTFDTCEINNFWAIVQHCNPKYWFMENVRDVDKVINKPNHLICCADYGVPTTRIRRIYTNIPLPETTHAKIPTAGKLPWVTVRQALGIDSIFQYLCVDGFKNCNQIERTRPLEQPAPTIMASRGVTLTNYKIFSTKPRHRFPLSELDKPAYTITAKDRGPQGPGDVIVHKPTHLDMPCKTIVTGDKTMGQQIGDGMLARKLTPFEKQLLQGFPKEYKFVGNKGDVQTQIGNALPPAITYHFFRQVCA